MGYALVSLSPIFFRRSRNPDFRIENEDKRGRRERDKQEKKRQKAVKRFVYIEISLERIKFNE